MTASLPKLINKHRSPASFSVVIPNYNGSAYLGPCLEALYKSLVSQDCPYEVILVDNGSIDTSLSLAASLLGRYFKNHYQLISLTKNHGFAAAVNLGINAARHNYVVLLNNDLTIKPDWFKILTPYLQNPKHPKTVTFFGTVLNRDGTKIESQGLKFFYRGKAQNIGNGRLFRKSNILNLKSSYVWGASAALVVYHRDTIKDIGLFDEHFFAYEEDVDLALRLHNFGFKTLYVPSALSCHLGGGTSGKMGNFRPRHDAKNWIYIIIKNYPLATIRRYWLSIIEERLRNLSGLCKITIRLYGLRSLWLLPHSLLTTYGQVILNLPLMLKKRKIIQSLIKSK